MKILMIFGGPKHYYGNFIEAMSKIADVDGVDMFGISATPYKVNNPKFKSIDIGKITIEEIKKYDVAIGLDHGRLDILCEIKKLGVKCGCQILDYPKHTFLKNKDYIESVKIRWDSWTKKLSKLDFIIHCKPSAQKELLQYHTDIPNIFYRLPVKIINFDKYERKDYIVYSGAINPQKGVHYIISALGIIENPPELVVIGDGEDLSSFASFLKVPYRQLKNVSEYDKFKMYHECRFLVYGHDSNYITSLSLTEGLGVGRTAVCFDCPEHRSYYKDFVSYCDLQNLSSMSNSIYSLYKDIKKCDSFSKDAPRYVREKHNFDIWAQNVYNFLKTI